MSQEESFNTPSFQNNDFSASNALKLRLDPTSIIENFELFLRGCKIVVKEAPDGSFITETIKIGRAKANDIGIQALLTMFNHVVNTQIVQGNFIKNGQSSTDYENYIYEVNMNFIRDIMHNLYIWEIDEYDFEVIINLFMNLAIPYATRLIDNKERDSYQNTVRHIESSMLKEIPMQQKKGFFNLMKNNDGGMS